MRIRIRNTDTKSPKQDSKRFNSQARRNTLPIWVCLIYGSDLGGHVEGEELGYDKQDGEDGEDQDPLPIAGFTAHPSNWLQLTH